MSETHKSSKASSGREILILGGGFAGTYLARYLRKTIAGRAKVSLIDKNNYFVFQPLLPEVASGTLNAQDAVVPLRAILKDTSFRMAEVRSIDLEAEKVTVLQGRKRRLVDLKYDQLVIAFGRETNLSMLPGFTEHAFSMKNLADAYILRNHVLDCLESADVTEHPSFKRRLLTFVVAGGGFSGVETAGELAEMLEKALPFYPNIKRDEIKLHIIHNGPCILPELPERLGRYAHRVLGKNKLEIVLNTTIQSATPTHVELGDGSRLETFTLITTVGTVANHLLKDFPVPLIHDKLPVDNNLRVKGYENVWAIGDSALIPLGSKERSWAPPTAQFARKEACCLAENLAATINNKPLKDFHYEPIGNMASIGSRKGVATIKNVRFAGFLAWFIWRALYLFMIPGFATKTRIMFDWILDLILPRSIVKMPQRETNACRGMRFAKGDVISRPGQLASGFYMVVSGLLELVVEDPEGDKPFRRLFRPGDHWGERVVSSKVLTRGTVTALAETRTLVLGKEDFLFLRESFPPLDAYFQGIPESDYADYLHVGKQPEKPDPL